MDNNPDNDKKGEAKEAAGRDTRAGSPSNEKKTDPEAGKSGRSDASTSPSARAKSRRTDASVSGREKKDGKKSPMRKYVVLAVILFIAVAGYFLWDSARDKGFGDGFAGGNGRLEATEIDLATKLAGRIMEIHVDEGDRVSAGEELAVMQTDVLFAQLNEARAQVAKAKASELSAQAQVAVKISDLNASRATVAQRQSELEQTRRRLERSSVLSEKGVITGQQFDDDETTEMAAKAAVDSAQAQVGVSEAAVAAARADAEGAVAAVKAAEATVASIEADIRDSHLKAPRSGRVQYRIVQPGEVLAAGGKVLNFVDLSDVYMNFFLPAGQYGRVAMGAEARIVLDAFPDRPIPAKISFAAQTAQFTPKTVETASEREKLMFRIKAKIEPATMAGYEDMVKPGLPGMAWVRLDPGQPWPEALTVKPPRAAPARAAE